MIIEENQLRPPSPKEMEARYVPLERITINWQYDCWDDTFCRHDGVHDSTTPMTYGIAYSDSAEFTTLELIEFHKQWAIPYEAVVTAHDYDGEKALDWRHIVKCDGCDQWIDRTQEHDTADTSLHGYIIRGRTAQLELAREDARKRKGKQ